MEEFEDAKQIKLFGIRMEKTAVTIFFILVVIVLLIILYVFIRNPWSYLSSQVRAIK